MSTLKPLVPPHSGLSLLERPRFSPGLLLEDEDLTAGVVYTREINRLLFRSLFGCGVICGLDVKAALTCEGRKLEVTVERGLALDCLGNPIHVPKAQRLTYDPDCVRLPPWVWVTVCYVEKCCRPRDVSCTDDESQPVHTRSHDGFEIRLYGEQPGCACSCERPAEKEPHSKDECCPEGESSDSASAKSKKAEESQRREKDDPCWCYADHNEGVCACDCGCTCVVIGKIRTTTVEQEGGEKEGRGKPAAERPLEVVRDIVRWIRPVLTGYLKCLKQRAGNAPQVAMLVEQPRPEPKPKPLGKKFPK